MGAWGTEIFEDDTALDFLEEAVGSNAKAIVKRALECVSDSYIQYDDCQCIWVACCLADMSLNKTIIDHHVEGLDDWCNAQPRTDFAASTKPLAAALRKILSDGSEINELWQENGELYSKWRSGIEALEARLLSAK